MIAVKNIKLEAKTQEKLKNIRKNTREMIKTLKEKKNKGQRIISPQGHMKLNTHNFVKDNTPDLSMNDNNNSNNSNNSNNDVNVKNKKENKNIANNNNKLMCEIVKISDKIKQNNNNFIDTERVSPQSEDSNAGIVVFIDEKYINNSNVKYNENLNDNNSNHMDDITVVNINNNQNNNEIIKKNIKIDRGRTKSTTDIPQQTSLPLNNDNNNNNKRKKKKNLKKHQNSASFTDLNIFLKNHKKQINLRNSQFSDLTKQNSLPLKLELKNEILDFNDSRSGNSHKRIKKLKLNEAMEIE